MAKKKRGQTPTAVYIKSDLDAAVVSAALKAVQKGEKRGRGRPATGHTPKRIFRMDEESWRLVRDAAANAGKSVSEFIRSLLPSAEGKLPEGETETAPGVTKAFSLPEALICRLEICTKLRASNLNTVVRMMLEEQIVEFYKTSLSIRDDRLNKVIKPLARDVELQRIFDENKDREEFQLPVSILTDQHRLKLLSTAFASYKDEQKIDSYEVLMFLYAWCLETGESSLADQLIGLASSIDEGRLAIKGQVGKREVVLSSSLKSLVEQGRRDIPEVRRVCKLIDSKLLDSMPLVSEEILAKVKHTA